MVILYTGTPGSGKSYHATALVHRATKRGMFVIANFMINLPKQEQQDRFFFLRTDQITVDYLINFSKSMHEPQRESQTIVFIDEASVLFNSRDFGRSDRSDWVKFFAQHRKLGFDVILITQMDRSLDRQIRGVIEYQYVHRKLNNFGFKGWIIKLLTHKQFVCVHQWYTIKERLGAEYFRINKKIASSYDTFSLFDDKDEGGKSGFVAEPLLRAASAEPKKLKLSLKNVTQKRTAASQLEADESNE